MGFVTTSTYKGDPRPRISIKEFNGRRHWRYSVVLCLNAWPKIVAMFSDLQAAKAYGNAFEIPEGAYLWIDDERGKQRMYDFKVPYLNPNKCHNCGKWLPDGCGGSNRDDLACLWDQPSKWPKKVQLIYKLKTVLGIKS